MYKAPIYYVVGSLSEDDSTWSGPAFGCARSIVISKGLGGVGPAYGFSRNPFTFCGRISPTSVPSVNVPFSATTIQYGPVHRVSRAFSPCASEIRARPYLFRSAFHSAPGADPQKVFNVVSLVRGSPNYVLVLRRVRGVVVGVLVRRLSRASAASPECASSESGILRASRLPSRKSNGTVWIGHSF